VNDPDLLAAAMEAAGYQRNGTRRDPGGGSFADEVLGVDDRNLRRWLSGERELQGTARLVCAAIVARPALAQELVAVRARLRSSASTGRPSDDR
jgi:hypothetical protein